MPPFKSGPGLHKNSGNQNDQNEDMCLHADPIIEKASGNGETNTSR